jgi:hypothetical protein
MAAPRSSALLPSLLLLTALSALASTGLSGGGSSTSDPPCPGGYVVAGAGNASVDGCYRPNGTLFGAPVFVKDQYSWLFKYCGVGCPFSTELWRLGLPVAQSASCGSDNASCWTLKKAYYTMSCASQWPTETGWKAWGYAHNGSLPTLHGAKLSSSCSSPQPSPAPGPAPGPAPAARCGYTASLSETASGGHESALEPAAATTPVQWTSNCTCVNAPGSITCKAVDMAQESSPATCTPDLRSVPADLIRPPMRTDLSEPVAGSRVKQTHPAFAHTAAYHALYLPPQWKKDGKAKLPVLVEYSGNGPWKGSPGVGDGHWADPDVSTGRPEDQNMGYGVSGGQGFIWISMPLLTADLGPSTNVSTYWWGCNSTMAFVKPCGKYDLTPTLDYTKKTLPWVISKYGGDPDNVFVMGWSRGAIATSYIALYDDEIAKLWKGFIPFSHIDGMISWGFPGSDLAAAKKRYARARGRPIFVTAECDIATNCQKEFIVESGLLGLANFTFQDSGFRNHNDEWLLRPSVARTRLRRWIREAMGLPAQLPLCTAGVLPPFCACTLLCPGGCCVSNTPAASVPPTCSADKETLRDDFNGTELNASIWTALDQIHRGGLYHPSNVAVHDGMLWMKTAPHNRTEAGQLWFMSSGAVNSSNRFQQQYGVFEVKAMPYYCPQHTQENATKPFAFVSHNTFWMYGFVEHPSGEQSEGCNCPEEIDVWEMGAQNWHITGDERVNNYTNRSRYCEACTGPFERTAPTFRPSPVAAPFGDGEAAAPPPSSAVEAAVAACAGGYVVAGAGTPELNGCYAPTAEQHNGTAVYQLQPSPGGVYANASLFLYPALATERDTSQWLWRIGTFSRETGLVEGAFYSAPCATGDTPLEFGWAAWGGSVHTPPPVLHAGAGKRTASTCPLPSPDKPPQTEDCSVLKMQTWTVEWRESYARIYVDGNAETALFGSHLYILTTINLSRQARDKLTIGNVGEKESCSAGALVSEYSAATWSDDAERNYFGHYTDDIIYGVGGKNTPLVCPPSTIQKDQFTKTGSGHT